MDAYWWCQIASVLEEAWGVQEAHVGIIVDMESVMRLQVRFVLPTSLPSRLTVSR